MKKLFLFLLFLSITASLFAQLAGENDLSFNPMDLGNGFGDGANGVVNSIAVQEDGKIILGGSFTHYNNMSSKHIVRLNTNGTIDESFNIDFALIKIFFSLIYKFGITLVIYKV
jgi:hypothetical protein